MFNCNSITLFGNAITVLGNTIKFPPRICNACPTFAYCKPPDVLRRWAYNCYPDATKALADKQNALQGEPYQRSGGTNINEPHDTESPANKGF